MFCRRLLLLFIFVHWNLLPINASIQPTQVRENVNVTLTCRFDSKQASVSFDSPAAAIPSLNKLFDPSALSDNIILWYKDENQVIGVNSISNDPKKYLIHQENFYTYQLTLISVQLESSGLYKCQNFTAKEENRFQVNVMGKLTKTADCRDRVYCVSPPINLRDWRRLLLLWLEYVKQTVGNRGDMLISCVIIDNRQISSSEISSSRRRTDYCFHAFSFQDQRF